MELATFGQLYGALKILISYLNSRKLEYACDGLTALNLFTVERLPIPRTTKEKKNVTITQP